MGVFDEVKERVTAREVMERAGIVFNRNNMCRCPFHQDKTASMKVKPTDKKYFCFGCGEKGDAIDFVAKYYNRSPREAAMQIADEFGIIYDSSVRSPPKPVRREKSPMQILEETKTKTYEPYRIKVLNTINFKKSMHYNPFAYIHSEKDILKLVTTLIANTKGEGKAGDDFWVKAETLLYCALIGYIHYEAPVEEQNFSTLIEFINAMEVREDDEEFKNPVDLMFDALESEKPNHFAVRQYKKYKLAAGDICSK